jgi:hypothetical protein
LLSDKLVFEGDVFAQSLAPDDGLVGSTNHNALVCTTDDVLTNASYSHHGNVYTRERQHLHFDAQVSNNVKVVYHKDTLSTGGITHAMRFAQQDEDAENHSRRWLTPPIDE